MASPSDLARLRALSNTVAIVGVGETDYSHDYRQGRSGGASERGAGGGDSYTLAARALGRALDDAGLQKSDLDGLCAGGPVSHERLSEVLGLNPRWGASGDAPRCIVEAVQAINAGLCSTVALVYGNAQRSLGT